MTVWDNPAVIGALGVAFGGATAYIQSALVARTKTGEELRDQRLDAYPPVWLLTSNLSKHPPADMTWADLEQEHLGFRRWYYTTGGLFLSERSRDRYGDVQEVIGAYLEQHRNDGPGGRIERSDYDAIANTCSAFRTALTEDLATRRQRSFLLTLKSRRWHRQKERQAEAVLKRFGERPLRLPVDEMRL